ncbi:hypothetical protein [uncultured Amphritea sp.]|uniref:hypothetical protein n=1 Tax=uncultured Amphritea sp. TaxID=981605 RepID=UPI002618E75E|nr:hypothetical protein [uncultured Amphritea sp.]
MTVVGHLINGEMRTDAARTQPVYNPMSHLVYAISRLQVSDVWVAGKQLLKEGKFTQLDIEQVVAQTNQWANKARPFSKNNTVTTTEKV